MVTTTNTTSHRYTKIRLLSKVILAALLMAYLAMVTGCGPVLNSLCGGVPTLSGVGAPDEGRSEDPRQPTTACPETES